MELFIKRLQVKFSEIINLIIKIYFVLLLNKICSLHTAISPDSTLMTAIEFTDEEYEVAKKAQAVINVKKVQINKSCKF